MDTISFESFIKRLVQAIDTTNLELIDKMTEPDMKYVVSCVKPDVTFENYYRNLKNRWDNAIYNSGVGCDLFGKLMLVKNIPNLDPNNPQFRKTVVDGIVDLVIKNGADQGLDRNFKRTVDNIINVVVSRSGCWSFDIIALLIRKNYSKYVGVLTDEQLKEKIGKDVESILQKDRSGFRMDEVVNRSIKDVGKFHFIDIESELDKLIPDKLASLKKFFIKTISVYYNNISPIVFAQILRAIFVNFFIELPSNEEELFSFFSRQLLLNSGPFILKIIQQIRPVMSSELQKKYNLTKLSYPVMLPDQYHLVLQKALINYPYYVIDYDKSASVGHVFIVHNVIDHYKFVVKVTKPIAIAQSCWEYSVLSDLYPKGGCEYDFVHSMLEATGTELNSVNEIGNIRKAHEIYPASYPDVFSKGKDVVARLSCINIVDKVIKPDCWYALAMTLAPGQPISSLVEGDRSNLEVDTHFRACLHRCLDIFVYKFFVNIYQHGFYHGDPHAGNLFFSYPERVLTLIDLGAVGHIDLFKNDLVVDKLVEIVLMSTFSNYGEMLDVMTELINSKCGDDSKIDMNGTAYREFRSRMVAHQMNNIKNSDLNKTLSDEYEKYLFSEERIRSENSKGEIEPNLIAMIPENVRSPYTLLEVDNEFRREKKMESLVTDNTEPLAYDFNLGQSKSIGFGQVLAEITEFYATNGVNIAIKFSQFYELLKAYILLLGVLSQTHYPNERIGIVMKKIVYDKGNISKLLNLRSTFNMGKIYQREKENYNKLKSETVTGRYFFKKLK